MNKKYRKIEVVYANEKDFRVLKQLIVIFVIALILLLIDLVIL